MDILTFCNKYASGAYRRKGYEIEFKECLMCQGGQHKDQWTFSINTEKKTCVCLRGSCGYKGTVRQLFNQFGEKTDEQINFELTKTEKYKSEYKRPERKTTPVENKGQITEYLKNRGISRRTLEYCGIEQKNDVIAFNFFNPDNELIFIKYRLPREPKIINGKKESKSWREKDCEPIFWLMNKCDTNEPLVITEGEIDAMTLIEIGKKNIVSLPSGTNDLTCLTNCWDWLEKFNQIIIYTDKDAAGKKCETELINRLGAWRCWTVNHTCKCCKDANEILKRHGAEILKNLLSNPAEAKLDGLMRLAEVRRLDYDTIPKITTGIKKLDNYLGGLYEGSLTIFTGVNSSGKSTLINQIALNNINEGQKVCFYSGELPRDWLKYWIDLTAAGQSNLTEKYNEIKQCNTYGFKPAIRTAIEKWYFDKLFIYQDANGNATADNLFNTFGYAYRRYGVKVFIIDNLMTINFGGGEYDFYRKQSEFIGRLKHYAKENNLVIILLAHPRKSKDRITKMDISGSGDITNLADIVLSIHRFSDEEKNKHKKYAYTDVLVEILKNRLGGIQDKEIELNFNPPDKRYTEINEDDFNKQYKWIEFLDETETIPF